MGTKEHSQITDLMAALERIKCAPFDRGRDGEVGMEANELGGKYGLDQILTALGIEQSPVKDMIHPDDYGTDFQLLAYYMILHQELKIMELQNRLNAIEGNLKVNPLLHPG